jgi:hypothetical protein
MTRRALLAALAAATALLVAEPARATLYASTFDGSLKLVRLDPGTLRPLGGRAVRLSHEPLGWTFSPDRSRLVTGSTARGARLRFIDLRRMRALGGITVSRRGSGIATAWAGRRRVLAVVVQPGCCGAGDTIVAAVDPERRRVLWRRRLGGSLQAGERLGGRLLLVLGPRGQALGPSRLVEVGAQGLTRSVALPEIVSGSEPREAATERWSPGLALDRAGQRGFVVQAGAPVVEVDLRSFTARSLALPPAAQAADAASGPRREAVWLGRGMLAITGTDTRRSRETPAGLTLVDTRRWVARRLDAQTTDVTLASGTLLASSFIFDPARQALTGSGLTGYSITGRRRFHLFGRAPIAGAQPLGARALVGGMRATALIDARSSRRLRSFRRFALTLISRDAPIQAG